MCMTSPPFWGLRDYGIEGQIGLEHTSEEYVQKLIPYFHELRRILKITGSFYLNLGDTYMKKNLQMIPARVAMALQKDGWLLRNDIIWYKPNHMPSSVKDRLTNTYEHLFHFVKNKKYYYDLDSIRIPHKTGPASFNYRVREAKRSSIEIVGVKASYEEMKEYDSRGQRVRGFRVRGNAGLGQEQYHGRRVSYHPKGGNPGNIFYETKFDETCQAKSLSRSLAYARRILGGEHETALNHPLGKNPGDVIATYRDCKCIPDRHHGSGPSDINRNRGSNPLGKNPGDVLLPNWKEELMRTHRPLHPPDGVSLGGGNLGLRDCISNKSSKYKGRMQLRQDEKLGGNVGLAQFRDGCRTVGTEEGHPLGKNPGDVTQANTVRHKSWMSNSGHPYTHTYTGKPLNPGDFWEIRPKPFLGAHFAVYPEALCIRPILSSCPPNGVVLDPFVGSGTTMKVALELGRNAIGVELNPKYIEIIKKRVPLLKEGDIIQARGPILGG